MNKFDPTKLQTKFANTSEGWLVQVYSSDRRLLCVFDASHAWTFLWGCGFGLLLAVGWFNLARYTSSMTHELASYESASYESAKTLPKTWID